MHHTEELDLTPNVILPEATMGYTEELDLTTNVILPEATMGHTEELDLTANVIFNQIAIHQLQEEQRGVQEGVRSMLMVIANMTEGVKERENATRRLLDTLDQLEWVNKAHQADNLKLEEENTRLNTAIHLLEEDNRKTKNEGQLAQEEIVLLKSQIRQVEEDSRLVKEDNIKTKNEVRLAQEENIQLKSQIRQVEEDSRLVKEEIILVEEENRKTKNDVRLSQEENRLVRAELRQVEEDARQVKERIRELELAETQAQDMNNAAKTRVAELEREIKLLQETNNKTEGEKRHVEDQLSLLEKEKRDVEDQLSLLEKEKRDVDSQLLLLEEQVMVLQTSIAALEEDKEGQAQKINRVESEKNRTEVKSRLMEEEHQECKRNVTELSARLLSARDCAELYCKGARQDGVYLIIPGRNGRLVSAWCDMTTDGVVDLLPIEGIEVILANDLALGLERNHSMVVDHPVEVVRPVVAVQTRSQTQLRLNDLFNPIPTPKVADSTPPNSPDSSPKLKHWARATWITEQEKTPHVQAPTNTLESGTMAGNLYLRNKVRCSQNQPRTPQTSEVCAPIVEPPMFQTRLMETAHYGHCRLVKVIHRLDKCFLCV
ncbi:myosin heavy chain, clone 203-like [Procambarus clarkii]|uniref:myosin heavy chain, clone 203-like n=1 Tax=Procambarus clarkii TaxID=6728 RepID=UPI0037440F6C